MVSKRPGAYQCLLHAINYTYSSSFTRKNGFQNMLNNEKLAGLIVFTFAFIGVVANWTVAILIRKLPSLKNSFGRLTASQSIGDAIHCTIFAFLFAPMCFL
ncbi:hypothetical protein CRE_15957 [Caenorhabditis remanei]|uniref:7TM GPCR serpentine receptor class x (Srx) domain-containing protein n=1 Tax=Caenorhabditis remanei TaxID=31234 RepID=E3MBS2_CAERE|nr:hypothetical protein CRE_15957 [Caenorhabditis remanei]